ncbi:MAG TPA: hypothetical protein PK639_00330 [Candidatus Woesebacteria bacterium]|nr:hypothetical protein [Candidatus Woesebacteria bacterium]
MSDKGEMPFKKVVEVIGEDGSSTFISVNPDSTPKESMVSTGLSEVIKKIPTDIPQAFIDQAQEVAAWITANDSGKEIVDHDKYLRWLGQIYGQIKDIIRIWPEGKFPKWLTGQEARRSINLFHGEEKIEEEEYIESRAAFVSMAKELEIPIEKENNGWFINITDAEIPAIDGYKAYLGERQVLALMREKRLEQYLKESNLLPESLKYYEGAVIMYFRNSQCGSDEITQELMSHGLNPVIAQDVYDFEIRDEKIYGPNFKESNDSSFNYWDLPAGNYDQVQFFQSYLEFCLKTGKRPTEPFMTVFGYLISDGSIDSNSPRISKLREKIKTPLVLRDKIIRNLD